MATILMVDDDANLCRALTAMLKKDEHHVMTARNGKEALEQITLHKPDLIISDIMMPVMDGWTLLQKLKSHADLIKIPVIMLSAFDEDEERMRAMNMQADALISKHLTFRVIRIQVKKILRAQTN